VVVPYKFDVPQQGGGRGATAQPPVELKAQPIGAVIVGNLFADDLILSVAHQLQVHTDIHLKRPAI
jgi:Asp-tRNA(Asn)/Glu-tRNA(Gln) amidotransferase A subunit family amidase